MISFHWQMSICITTLFPSGKVSDILKMFDTEFLHEFNKKFVFINVHIKTNKMPKNTYLSHLSVTLISAGSMFIQS